MYKIHVAIIAVYGYCFKQYTAERTLVSGYIRIMNPVRNCWKVLSQPAYMDIISSIVLLKGLIPASLYGYPVLYCWKALSQSAYMDIVSSNVLLKGLIPVSLYGYCIQYCTVERAYPSQPIWILYPVLYCWKALSQPAYMDIQYCTVESLIPVSLYGYCIQ